jgi:uncharacterized membrane protein (DUF4010 family)
VLKDVLAHFPPEGIKILLVLFLSFLIGLEREEKKAGSGHYYFGGVRTFPLIGLLGYAMALISGNQLVPLAVGFAVVGAFLLVSYLHKLRTTQDAGVTTEISGLGTFVLGVLVQHDRFWIATTIVVLSMLLLELKTGLENLAQKIPAEDISTFTKFLLITAVILPVVPNEAFTEFHLNPFQTWLIVVAVSSISYLSYVLQKVTRGRGGVILSAMLGGAYSSTATTVVLAKKAREADHSHLFSGAILMASGVMYLRLTILVDIFNPRLGHLLTLPFLLLSAVALLAGWLWSHEAERRGIRVDKPYESKNPLELSAAFLFAIIFVAVLILTDLTVKHLGIGALYALSALMGVTDVDPFILSLTQTAGAATAFHTAAAGIVIASASNNFVKGLYAFAFADRKTGVMSLASLAILTAAGLLPLFLI